MDDLRTLWIRLNRPAPERFHRELKRRDIFVPLEELRKFYSLQRE
jgi:hypothetical protein